ncbi:MAG: hypothetical protein JRE20_05930 [Deltaproteobacteria bacterium]|nr:hypothetical protein [Deltaproteobacteria bacterium]
MEWDEEARELIMKAPEGIIESAVDNVERFAQDRGYGEITKKVVYEQMEDVGLDPEEMFTEQ